MKLINVSEGPVVLDDIGDIVLYDSKYEPYEIQDGRAKRSRSLRHALALRLLVDVTESIPTKEELDSLKDKCRQRIAQASEQSSQDSLFARKQSILVSDEPKLERAPMVEPPKPPEPLPSATEKPAVVWTGPACFPAGTGVLTIQGVVPIDQIKVGDQVFTDKGKTRVVVNCFLREYKGDLVSVRTFLNNEEIRMTKNHIVLAIKSKPCKLRPEYPCKPSCNTQYNKVKRDYGRGSYFCCVKQPYKGYAVEEVPAGDLDRSCYLLLPKNEAEGCMKELSLSENLGAYDKFTHDDNIVWPSPKPMSSCKSTLAREAGFPLEWIYEIDKLSASNAAKASEILNKPGFVYDPMARQGIAIPNKIKLSKDFGRFIGLYLAEGTSASSTIGIHLHENETETASFVSCFAKDHWKLDATVVSDHSRHAQSVCLYSAILANFLKYSCGNDCYSKRIPPWAFNAPHEFLSGLITGLWEGDGTKPQRKKDNSIKFGTSSRSLAYGIQYLLGRFGVACSMDKSQVTRKKFGHKTYRYDKPCVFYTMRISGQQLYRNPWLLGFRYNNPERIPSLQRERNYFVFGDYIAVKVRSIKTEDFHGYVYNIEVEGDHSYLVNGKCVKNCDAGGFAKMNRQFMFGLEKMGMTVKYDNLKSMQDMDPTTHLHIKRLERVQVPKDAIKVYGQTAPGLYDYSRYRMLFTMMETRRLHPMYVDRCSFADEVVVPSKWCKQMFEESGVKRPISVVPLGVDTNIYHRGVEPISFSKSLKPFVFLSVFGWSLRKGYDVLLKAYLEEFTEDDPVSLLISSRFFGCTDESKKKRIRDDVAKVRATIRNPKQPHLVLFGDVLSEHMMPRMYAAASCYVLISRGEGFGLPYCCPAGSPILLSNGKKCIEDIKEGDAVIGSDGNKHKVSKTMSRPYIGELVELRALLRNDPIRMTPEHPVWVVRKLYRRSNDRRHLKVIPRFVQASTIRKGDLLVLPRPKLSSPSFQSRIDLVSFLDMDHIEYDEAHVWSKYSNKSNGITAKLLSEKSGVSKRQVYRVMEASDRNSKIDRISEGPRRSVVSSTKELGYDDRCAVKINRRVTLDEKLGYLLGLFAAEGYCSKSTVSFAFHENETNLHGEVKKSMREIFGLSNYSESNKTGTHTYEITFCSSILSLFFEKLFGKGAKNKKINNWILESPLAVKKEFLRGITDGDGIRVQSKTSVDERICTSSEQMAYQCWMMSAEQGSNPTLMRISYRDNGEFVVRHSLFDDRKRTRSPYVKTVPGADYILCPVISVGRSQFNGSVYNFEVAEVNSYCLDGFAVHNCEAAACGLPVIASRYSAHTDFLDDENSYLVDVDGFRSAEKELAWISQFYENAEFPIFGPKAVEQTRALMRYVFEHQDEAKEKAERLHRRIMTEYTWDAVVPQMYNKIVQVYEDRKKRATR